MRRAPTLAILCVLTAACGHAAPQAGAPTTTAAPAPTAPTTPATTTSTQTSSETRPQTVALRVYFLRDGKIAPVLRAIPATRMVATAALRQLARGVTPSERQLGLESDASVPVTLVAITNGIARVEATQDLTHEALAQVVYTLTQFPTVSGVRMSRMISDAKPLTRADFEDVTPAILVESPLPGETVTSPLEVRGSANTFEATFELELRNSSGVRVAWRFVTATSGSGQRGTFATTISFPHTGGPLTLVAYESSAASGRRIHVVRVPLGET